MISAELFANHVGVDMDGVYDDELEAHVSATDRDGRITVRLEYENGEDQAFTLTVEEVAQS